MSLNIGVFCGSKIGGQICYTNVTKKLANWIGKNKYNIVFGGTDLGLMRVLVKEASKYNIRIYGISTKFLTAKFCNEFFSTDLIVTQDLEKRKKQFLRRSDCFVALPGGIGTINEVFDFIVKKELKETSKKIFLINENNFWDPFQNLLNHLINEKFLEKRVKNKLFEISSIDQCFNKIKKISL